MYRAAEDAESTRGKTDDPPLADDVLSAVLGAAHADASQIIAKLWRLPNDLQLVLAHHHTVSIGGYTHPTAAVIALAERLVAEEGGQVGLPPSSWDFTPPSSLRAAEQALQITEPALDKLRKRALELLTCLAQTD